MGKICRFRIRNWLLKCDEPGIRYSIWLLAKLSVFKLENCFKNFEDMLFNNWLLRSKCNKSSGWGIMIGIKALIISVFVMIFELHFSVPIVKLHWLLNQCLPIRWNKFQDCQRVFKLTLIYFEDLRGQGPFLLQL